MNETKRNEIAEFCESLTQDEAIELCKKLIAENEELIAENKELISENEELKVINRILHLAYGIPKVVIEHK